MRNPDCNRGRRSRSGFALAAALVLALLAVSCSGGGRPAPLPSVLLGIAHGASGARVYGAAGSADAGTTVTASAGATGAATVASDGSFSLELTGAGAAGATATVSYTKQGEALSTVVTLRDQNAQVDASLFATGAAPNDIAISSDALYVANSLDNTVVKYSLDGASLATHSFAQFASPSFLTSDGNAVWTVCNGANTLAGLRQSDLTPLNSALFEFTGAQAFIGPASPLAVGTSIYVPRNQIETFGPTTYGPGIVSRCDFGGGEIDNISTFGRNPGFCAYDSARDLLYVVSTGEIQFDENFVPFVDSDGFLEIYDAQDNHSRVATINLGRSGPQRIAISADGQTAYLGNAVNGNLYKVNLVTRTVERGLSNPIILTSESTYISDVQFAGNGEWLLATSFNTDELFVLDPDTDSVNAGPYPSAFDLDGQTGLLSGAARMAIGPAASANTSARVYVVMGIANAVASVDLF